MSIRTLFSLCILLFALPSAHAQTDSLVESDPQVERIARFDSLIEVRPNGDLFVTETITVFAMGDAIKRGIYRDFPTRYPASYGLQRKVDFEVLEVIRDGSPEPWNLDWHVAENGVRVYIGNPDQMLTIGQHTYTIRYRTNRQIVQTEEFDELYWNVTGNGWAFPILEARAKVRLPSGAEVLSAEAYTGPAGAQGTNWKRLTAPGGEAILETTAVLAPSEGFTISVTFPKGIMEPGANPNHLGTLLLDNFFTFLSLVCLVLVFVYFFVTWSILGRDPKSGVIIPQYAPPKGFTPSAVRYVAGMGRFDDKSFASAVLQLAVSGALQVVKNKDFTLIKTGKPPELQSGQKKFFDALLGSREKLELVQSNHAIMKTARDALSNWLRTDFEKAYFIRNFWIWFGGLFLSLIPAALSLIDAANVVVPIFLLIWLSFWTVGVNALISSVISKLRSGQFLTGLPLLLFSLPFVIGWLVGFAILVLTSSFWMILVFVSGALLNLVFYHLLKAPTLEGQAVMDHIEGFKHYLGVAERDRLNLENPPERTPEVFEKFLPYALALDVEQRWAEQFAEVLEAANYQPEWCVGTGFAFSSIGAVGLASSLGGSMTSAISSSSTAPGSSSGSGGGGSSGGGGGGGGGGGW